MAKMTPIPKINYERAGGSVPNATLPDAEGVSRGIEVGANAVADVADAQQKSADKILAEKQKIVDTVTATRTAGDYETKLRNHADQLKQQFVDTPEKAPDEFQKNARDAADDAIKNAPNPAVQLELAHRTASITEEMTKSMDTWSKLRATQKAKSDLSVMVNQATRGAEDQYSTNQLSAFARSKHKELDPLFDNLTGDGQKAREHLDNEIAKSWVVANGARDPVNTLKALDSEKGFLVDHLTAEDRKSLRTQLYASMEGTGRARHAQTIKEGIDQTGQAGDLFRSGELTSGAVFSMQRANEQKRLAISLDPNLKEDTKQAQLKAINTQNETLRQMDLAMRRQSGFGANPDQGVRGELLARYNGGKHKGVDYDGLFDNVEKSPMKSLTDISEFRHDLFKAYAAGNLSRSDLDRMDRGISLALPKAMVGATKAMADSYTSFKWREPRIAGNAALNDLLDEKAGLFVFNDKQRNDARLFYLEQVNEATENGTPITAETTQAMARKAAYFVAGKRMPK